jgi:hypothetical protein
MPPPRDSSQWHGTKLLATGGYGAAGLWVEADATNNIINVRIQPHTFGMLLSNYKLTLQSENGYQRSQNHEEWMARS